MKPPLKALLEGFGLVVGGLGTFCCYEIYTENQKFYANCFMPLIHKVLDAETAHKAAVKALAWNLLPGRKHHDDPSLRQVIWNKEFQNPVGIAAGFDKDAEAMVGLSNMGFGFIEVGSVTPLPQIGNPKPRVFRLYEDKAVINRYGFNSCGQEAAKHRLNKFDQHQCRGNIVLGVNLGKNKTSTDDVADYITGVRQLGKYADYIVINVSSPNTAGLRNLQQKKRLETLCKAILQERDKLVNKPPVLVKIAPDLSDDDKQDIAKVVLECNVEGLIVSNTTVRRPESLRSVHKKEVGGLSGLPVRDVSTKLISEMYQLTEGKVPIIGVGGISNGTEAYEKIKAGASLVQIYTALVYGGPPVLTNMKKDLVEHLHKDGYENISQAIGAVHQ
uniref:Dihydroorotate dehydrogenase (quinone), mitochondrial n=1 Tax=Phallusia mammillata TaxID=59560 RepID=A0A6F9DAQ8_9ASCI|nr:dihydroorotate dehydrogenase (quinone), mitochondrial-like [Phallusia mammillata]